MHPGDLIDLEITDINSSGEGVGRYQGKVIFVPDAVTGDRLQVRLTELKSKYARGKLHQLLTPSEYRIRPQCIVADKCGGCQWQHISGEYQRQLKRQQVIQSLQRIGEFPDLDVEPVLYTPQTLNYRNKSTYPLGRSSTGQVQAGYYRHGSHKIVNLNQCPVQDLRLHPLLKEVKQDIYERGWSIYNEVNHQGKLRHLSLRIGSRTGEILLTLVTTSWQLNEVEEQARIWLERYPQLVGVCLNLQCDRTNVIFGDQTRTIAGKPHLREIFAGVELHISSDTFFQVNTEAAELLLETIASRLNLTGEEILVDAYCGIGTFSLPLAKKVKQVIGIEVSPTSIAKAKQNAAIARINNISFYTGKVETCLSQLKIKPDLILLDPPRKGCAPEVISTLLTLQPYQIIYISCKPATLARDLKLICQSGIYRPTFVQPADFFPQTTHVECAVFLTKK
ncbi:MAG: 23S rRNA (uracil(1939)-C(5))-methyltransferase RlmD [Pleurocapsa sp.]